MTRACMFCSKTFGEKCAICGVDCHRFFFSFDPDTRERIRMFTCWNDRCEFRRRHRNLRHQFREGHGGTTHGVCKHCRREQGRQTGAAQAVSR